jgi:hypothetical protein
MMMSAAMTRRFPREIHAAVNPAAMDGTAPGSARRPIIITNVNSRCGSAAV